MSTATFPQFTRKHIPLAEAPQFLREQVASIAKQLHIVDAGVALERGGQEAFKEALDTPIQILVELYVMRWNTRYSFSIVTGTQTHALSFLWPKS